MREKGNGQGQNGSLRSLSEGKPRHGAPHRPTLTRKGTRGTKTIKTDDLKAENYTRKQEKRRAEEHVTVSEWVTDPLRPSMSFELQFKCGVLSKMSNIPYLRLQEALKLR